MIIFAETVDQTSGNIPKIEFAIYGNFSANWIALHKAPRVFAKQCGGNLFRKIDFYFSVVANDARPGLNWRIFLSQSAYPLLNGVTRR